MSILGMCTDAGIVRKQSIRVLTPACFPEICHFFLKVYNRGNITYLRFSLCFGGMQVMNYSLNALKLSMCSNLDASSSAAGGKFTRTLLCAKAEYLCSCGRCSFPNTHIDSFLGSGRCFGLKAASAWKLWRQDEV